MVILGDPERGHPLGRMIPFLPDEPPVSLRPPLQRGNQDEWPTASPIHERFRLLHGSIESAELVNHGPDVIASGHRPHFHGQSACHP
jgi:hypothetical protein